MSNENETKTEVAEVTCPRCEGCGQLANTDDREPWSAWASLPVGSAVAVTMGIVKPEPCDECGGTGKAATPEAETNSHTAVDYDGHVMRTPDDWCRIKRIQILDADGWRGRDAKDWDEPLTELDFEERAQVCTQRSVAVQPAGEHHTGTLNLAGEGNEVEAGIGCEIVETAAKAMFAEEQCDRRQKQALDENWHGRLSGKDQAEYRGLARAALTAALPALRRQIAEETAAWAEDLAAGVINRDKPYNQGFIHASETLARHAREHAVR